ncbi:hypothetical protein EXT73_06475 [Pectobacterium atrosepticum]|nr:hypothetical protein [Pectobacterium atrosepticum]QXE13511.1 hypothetical protein DCX48_02690 [Pectobacterium atrosepticum]
MLCIRATLSSRFLVVCDPEYRNTWFSAFQIMEKSFQLFNSNQRIMSRLVKTEAKSYSIFIKPKLIEKL